MRTANRTFIGLLRSSQSLNVSKTDVSAYGSGNLIGHTDRVTSVSIRHRDNLIVTASVDKSVRLWNANTQSCIGCVSDAHDSEINALSVSQLDHVCVSGDKKGALACWDFASMLAAPQAQHKVQVYQNLAGRATAITAVACSPHDASICAVGIHSSFYSSRFLVSMWLI
jgi:WD40 repeat protein